MFHQVDAMGNIGKAHSLSMDPRNYRDAAKITRWGTAEPFDQARLQVVKLDHYDYNETFV